ncbi:cellulase family glycosylhydrolase [Sphingomonas xinjiangensis]|nr:cellulase family glycosylhydrolase [Sphingomonas xinjiangensis]
MRLTPLFAVLVSGGAGLAFAGTGHGLIGENPTSGHIVCASESAVPRNQVGRRLRSAGTRSQSLEVWIDRKNGPDRSVEGAAGLWSSGSAFEGGTFGPTSFGACTAQASRMLITSAPVFGHFAQAKPRRALFGVNLSGAEAGGGDSVRPGLNDFKGYIERYRFKLIRYPFKMERMTPVRISELQANVGYARSKRVPVILDRHDYTWRKPEVMIADWTALARNFPDDGSVVLDLVNEPRGFDDAVVTNDWMQWIRDSKVIIAGLRKNGIRHPIALEYPGWSATFRFDKGEKPGKACESAGCAIDRDRSGPLDPINLTYISGHRYWDKGSSGTSMSCDRTWGDTSGFDRFAAQLRKRGLKAYITEAAFGASHGVKENCKGIGADAIADVKANSDVLLGITWWGGGRIWPEEYHFKIEPKKNTRFKVDVPPFIRQLRGEQRQD